MMNYQAKGIFALVASSLVTGAIGAWLAPEKVKGALAGSGMGAIAVGSALAVNRQQEDRLRRSMGAHLDLAQYDRKLAQLTAQQRNVADAVKSLSAQVEYIAKEHPSTVNALRQELTALKQTVNVGSYESEVSSTAPLVKKPIAAKKRLATRVALPQGDGEEFATVRDWFQARQVNIQGYHQPQPAIDNVLDDLAVYLGENYDVLEYFHKKLKSSIGRKISFHLQDKSQKEIFIHTQFFKKLKNSSLLSKGIYNKSDKVIIATPQKKDDVKFFLDGGWFERFVCCQVASFLDKKGADYQVFKNLEIAYSNGDRYELDIFFLVQGQPLLIECKAGKDFDTGINTFSDHRQRLNLKPGNALFVALQLEEKFAQVRTLRMEVTVTNRDSFLSHVGQVLAG